VADGFHIADADAMSMSWCELCWMSTNIFISLSCRTSINRSTEHELFPVTSHAHTRDDDDDDVTALVKYCTVQYCTGVAGRLEVVRCCQHRLD
jgi:hypothetical protein